MQDHCNTFFRPKTFSVIRRRFHPFSCGHGLKTTLFENVTAENARKRYRVHIVSDYQSFGTNAHSTCVSDIEHCKPPFFFRIIANLPRVRRLKRRPQK